MNPDTNKAPSQLSSSSESLPPPPYTTTWGNDVISEADLMKKERRDRIARTFTYSSVRESAETLNHTTQTIVKNRIWPSSKRFMRFWLQRRQLLALFLLITCAISPFIALGFSTRYTGDYYSNGLVGVPFSGIFSPKVITCGYTFAPRPQNSTVTGIEELFTLDFTFGRLTFSQAKVLDVAWDLGLGRGVQLVAWWVSYKVFSDALLRVIERHPATYETFMTIMLDGASMSSMWALFKDLFRTRSKRTKWLFFYLFLSTFYILSIPIILGAMTGYVATAVPWVEIGGPNQIVPWANFDFGYVVYSAYNISMNNTCTASEQILEYHSSYVFQQKDHCNCQLPNGTMLPYNSWRHIKDLTWYDNSIDPNAVKLNYDACRFDYANNTQTFKDGKSGKPQNCNGKYNITLFGTKYDIGTLNIADGYCDGDLGYSDAQISQHTRCLPDTANESYRWGFSTMLSGVFTLIQLAWALSMYAVWLDAHFNSELVKSGFRMSQLRAAFLLTAAAEARTGMRCRELVNADVRDLRVKLMGSGKSKGAKVSRGMFNQDVGGVSEEGQARRRRNRLREDEMGNVE